MTLRTMVVHTVTTVYRGEWLVEAREKAGLTQEEMARLVGWSHQRQSYLERPGRHAITAEVVERIDEVLQKAERSDQ